MQENQGNTEDMHNVTTVIYGLKIHRVILMKICDIKSIHFRKNYFKFKRDRYKTLICHGKISLLNQYSTNPQENSFKFQVDDGTGSIQAFYTVKKNESLEGIHASHNKYLEISNRFGLNIQGRHISPGSEEFQTIMKNVGHQMGMISENFKLQPLSFQYQNFNDNVYILAWPFRNRNREICLKILDLNKVNKFEELGCIAVEKFYDKRFQ